MKGTAKKQKKEMMSMLVKVLEEVTEPNEEPKQKQTSAKERLMQIVRGSGTLVGVVTAQEKERNYVPSRPKPSYRTVLMIGKTEESSGEYKPVRGNNVDKTVAQEEVIKPIQSLFTILKKEFDKNDESDKMETVEKIKFLMDREPSHSLWVLGMATRTRTHLIGVPWGRAKQRLNLRLVAI